MFHPSQSSSILHTALLTNKPHEGGKIKNKSRLVAQSSRIDRREGTERNKGWLSQRDHYDATLSPSNSSIDFQELCPLSQPCTALPSCAAGCDKARDCSDRKQLVRNQVAQALLGDHEIHPPKWSTSESLRKQLVSAGSHRGVWDVKRNMLRASTGTQIGSLAQTGL